QLFFFVFFSALYIVIVLGNLLIIIAVTSDCTLHSPMYFLLGNLSFLDICQASFATPKMIADFLSEHKTISFSGCIAQIFFIHLFTGGEMVLLVSMAYDRYVAICKPLRYMIIMNRSVCTALVIISWAVGLVHTLSQNLPFCGPNKVDSFFCDLPLVIKLACMDTYRMEILTLANSGLISLSCFLALIVSYIIIFVTVQHQASRGSSKALSTLTAHITVVILFFGPCIYFYFLSVFYIICTPLLNPVIYSLRNEDVKSALRKLRNRHINPGEKN
ncbi:Olfactory receptor 4K5, partial [Lemmus lemmus]